MLLKGSILLLVAINFFIKSPGWIYIIMTWQSLTNYNQDLKAFESSEEDWFDQNSVSQINGNWLNDLRSNMFVNSFRGFGE